MSKLSVTEAVKLTGVSKTTLYADINKGILSAEIDTKGRKRLDVAELQRVYGPLKPSEPDAPHPQNGKPISETPEQHRTPPNTESETVSLLKSHIELLERELSVARDRENNLMEMLKIEQEKTRLILPPPKRKRRWRDMFRMT